MKVRYLPWRNLMTCALALGLAGCAHGTCTAEDAKAFEERLAGVEAWSQFTTIYAKYKQCDASALSYGVSQAVAKLASNESGLVELSIAVKKAPWIRRVVLKHLASEAVTRDDAQRISVSARERCPSGEALQLCKEIQDVLLK